MTGDGLSNTFRGGLGADILNGGAGRDTFRGGAGFDTIRAGRVSGAESDGETDVIFFSKDDLGSRDFVYDFETAHDLFKLDVAAPGAIQFDDAIVSGQAATEVTVTADFNGVAGNETLTLELAPLGQRARRSVPLMKLAPAVAPAGQAMPPLAVTPMDPARLRMLLALTLTLDCQCRSRRRSHWRCWSRRWRHWRRWNRSRAAGCRRSCWRGSFRWRLLLGRRSLSGSSSSSAIGAGGGTARVAFDGAGGASGAAPGGGVVAGAS